MFLAPVQQCVQPAMSAEELEAHTRTSTSVKSISGMFFVGGRTLGSKHGFTISLAQTAADVVVIARPYVVLAEAKSQRS